jgi:hypothetical protein
LRIYSLIPIVCHCKRQSHRITLSSLNRTNRKPRDSRGFDRLGSRCGA